MLRSTVKKETKSVIGEVVMAGKKLDRVHAQSALETVRENPLIAVIAAAPALVVFGLVWWLAGFGTAVVLLLAIGVVGLVVAKLRS